MALAQYSGSDCIKLEWSDSAGVSRIVLVDSCQEKRDTIKVDSVYTRNNWVFMYSGCIRISARPAEDYWQIDTTIVPKDTIFWPPGSFVIPSPDTIISVRLVNTLDTIFFEDICNSNCSTWRTIPLGCWDSVEVRIDYEIERELCDSVCTTEIISLRDTSYYVLTQAQMLSLRSMAGGCWASGITTMCITPDGSGNWILNAKEFDPYYPRYGCPAPAACDTPTACCVPISVAYSYVWMNQLQKIDFGWQVVWDSTIRCQDSWRFYVVSKDTSNCRDTTITWSEFKMVGEWRSAGRDTTVYIQDTCTHCWKIYSVCEGGWTADTVWQYLWQKIPIYTADTTYDTAVCSRWYEIPTTVTYRPPDMFREVPCDLATGILSLSSWGKTWQPGYYKLAVTTLGGSCLFAYVTCDTAEGWPLDPVWYVPGWLLQNNVPTCDTSMCFWETQPVLNWCCSKDTTYTGFCEVESSREYVDTTVTIPDMSGPCPDSIRMNIRWTITGWDSLLVDSLPRVTGTFTGNRYVLVWDDTCYCEERLICASNGCKNPCIVFIRRECDPQPYWVGDTLVFPCDTQGEDAMEYASIVASSLSERIENYSDTLQVRVPYFIFSGTAVIGTGDSVRVSVPHLKVSDIAVVSYLHNDKFPIQDETTTLGAAIWTVGELVIHGIEGKKVSYMVMR